MGTSIEQIDKTYRHLLPDSLARTSSALDAFVNDSCGNAAEAMTESLPAPAQANV
jgi:hypothetical protein